MVLNLLLIYLLSCKISKLLIILLFKISWFSYIKLAKIIKILNYIGKLNDSTKNMQNDEFWAKIFDFWISFHHYSKYLRSKSAFIFKKKMLKKVFFSIFGYKLKNVW